MYNMIIINSNMVLWNKCFRAAMHQKTCKFGSSDNEIKKSSEQIIRTERDRAREKEREQAHD